MTKRRLRHNRRYTKKSETIDPYANLATDTIIDAIFIASGQSPASKKSRLEAAHWLRSEQCQRWARVIGVEIGAALAHRDSLVKLEEL